jgi:hypothetical protein
VAVKKRLLRKRRHIAVILALFGLVACGNQQVFDSIGEHFAGPVAVQASENGRYFFALNSDFDRQFNKGSLIVLDESGEKKAVIDVPRLGRAMKIVGDELYAVFDRSDEKGAASLVIFDVTDPLALKIVKSWPIDCTPVNLVARKGYPTFFASCSGGSLFVGEKEWDTLKLVRNYGKTRRALYLDSARELLFMFSTELAKQSAKDMVAVDSKSFAIDGTEAAGSNEIPDDFESTKVARRNTSGRSPYQFVVYDIAQERSAGFPYRALHDKKDALADSELRWLYFTLLNVDGTPDSDEGLRNLDSKFYRTNIWDAKINAEDPNSFYISHRGLIQGNNVIKVSLVGNPRSATKGAEGCSKAQVERSGFCVPKTDSFLSFDRVYGFKGEIDEYHYIGDFEIVRIKGRRILIANHFRDLVYWKPQERRFSVVVRDLDFPSWRSEVQSTTYQRSYFQIAASPTGTALTCSYYGGSVILLKVNPGEELKEVKLVD